jgi:hypothetical protein
MAYMTTENAKRIRTELKKSFPEFKFSVKKGSGNLSIDVTILSGPVIFDSERPDHSDLNPYYLNKYEHSEILERMIAIINNGNWDKSDIMTDYFNVGWYVHFHQGKWDKPYILTQ